MFNKNEQKNISTGAEKKEEPKKIIVEIGPGAIPVKTKENEKLVAIDAISNHLDSTGVNSDIFNKGGVDFVSALAQRLPLNNSADEIIMRNVLGHTFGGPISGFKTKDIKILCNEIKTALKRDGKFIIVETYTPPPLKDVKKTLLTEGFAVDKEISRDTCRDHSSESKKLTKKEIDIKEKYGQNMWENQRDMDSYILVLKKKDNN